MSVNTELWDRLGKTDPSHTKTFKRAGGFSGTAIKPMWSYRRMTEEFGPCGTGWGLGEPQFQVVPGPEGEMLVYCTASVWYGEGHSTVYGVGGDKVVGKNKYGLTGDDEAFKKAFTDAITNALKMIGVGADVHMGLFDDSKYVNTLGREFEAANQKQANDPEHGDGRSKHVRDYKNGEAKREEVLSKEKARPIFSTLQDDMRRNKSQDDLGRWLKDADVNELRAQLPDDWNKNLRHMAKELWDSLPKEPRPEDQPTTMAG